MDDNGCSMRLVAIACLHEADFEGRSYKPWRAELSAFTCFASGARQLRQDGKTVHDAGEHQQMALE